MTHSTGFSLKLTLKFLELINILIHSFILLLFLIYQGKNPTICLCYTFIPHGYTTPRPTARLTAFAMGTRVNIILQRQCVSSSTHASASTCLRRCILLEKSPTDGSVKGQYATQFHPGLEISSIPYDDIQKVLNKKMQSNIKFFILSKYNNAIVKSFKHINHCLMVWVN